MGVVAGAFGVVANSILALEKHSTAALLRDNLHRLYQLFSKGQRALRAEKSLFATPPNTARAVCAINSKGAHPRRFVRIFL